ncbi:hypothetical protein [Clostridium butyricum]|uniref:hypothetical protein n=1 Tax=Clostridium butyricum TaxID=1492 RepID=UPI00325B75C5
MKSKLFKRICSISAMSLILANIPIVSHAEYYIRPSMENINVGYKDSEEVFTSIDKEYYKEDYMRFKINSIKDITNDYETGYIKYNNIDKIVLIDYTYTNLQYKSMPMFIQPKIVFYNRVANNISMLCNTGDLEYQPTQLFKRDCDYLENFSEHPALRVGETGSWQVAYAIHNKLDGKPHDTIDINFDNFGNTFNKKIWSIPVSNLS